MLRHGGLAFETAAVSLLGITGKVWLTLTVGFLDEEVEESLGDANRLCYFPVHVVIHLLHNKHGREESYLKSLMVDHRFLLQRQELASKRSRQILFVSWVSRDANLVYTKVYSSKEPFDRKKWARIPGLELKGVPSG